MLLDFLGTLHGEDGDDGSRSVLGPMVNDFLGRLPGGESIFNGSVRVVPDPGEDGLGFGSVVARCVDGLDDVFTEAGLRIS